MDNRKIYCYHKLDPIDIFDSIEWARENYERYDGETSPLWNEHVQREFARISEVRLKHYYEEIEIIHEIDDFLEETN